jgi:hypothetical protein
MSGLLFHGQWGRLSPVLDFAWVVEDGLFAAIPK